MADLSERFLDDRVVQAQRQVCERYGVPYVPTRPNLKIGLNLNGEQYPIKGPTRATRHGIRQARRLVDLER